MLSNFSLYLKVNFEVGVWKTGANGHLFSTKTLNSETSFVWTHNCSSAIALYRERKYVQFRQILSQACRVMELSIRYELPDAVRDLLYSSNLMHRADLPEVASIILRHAYSVAATYLGASHPLAQMCGALQKLVAIPRGLRSRLLQCQLDHLEKELGPWHFSTAHARCNLLLGIDASEAVGRARASLAAYELTSSKHDDIWFENVVVLTRTLFDDRQYENAKRICSDILDAVNVAIICPHPHHIKADAFWQLSRIFEHGSSDIMEAEGYMRLAIAEAAAAWGWQDSATINFMLNRARLLRGLGRFDEAGEIETQIQESLGPPEIKELLS